MDPKKLYEEAGRLHHEAKSLMEKWDGKEMPADDVKRVDDLLDAVDQKTTEAKRAERALAQGSELREPANRLGAGSNDEGKGAEPSAEAKAFNRFLRHGTKGLNAAEAKALRVDDDAAGGFLAAPQTFATGLLKFVDDLVIVRSLATIEQIGAAESLGILSLDSDLSDAEWTSELATGSEDTVKPFGKRALKPHPLAKRVRISNTLLRRSTRPVETIVQDRAAHKFGVTLEKAYLTGDGAEKPLGLFTPSSDGIPVSRDVAASGSTAFTADDLIDTKYSLKGQYQQSKSTRWIVSREFMKRARKLKDGNGQYIWAPGLNGGTPNTILDIGVAMSEYAPATFTTGQYVALLGDIKFYYIVDALSLQVQVLNELYAETNQRGYIMRYEGDGGPQLAEAFARLKLA